MCLLCNKEAKATHFSERQYLLDLLTRCGNYNWHKRVCSWTNEEHVKCNFTFQIDVHSALWVGSVAGRCTNISVAIRISCRASIKFHSSAMMAVAVYGPQCGPCFRALATDAPPLPLAPLPKPVVSLPPASMCDVGGLTDVTRLWKPGTPQRDMIRSIETILRPFECMLKNQLPHDFQLQKPFQGIFSTLEDRLVWNASRIRTRRREMFAMVNPMTCFRHGQSDHQRWLAEHFQFVPVIVWSNGTTQCEISSSLSECPSLDGRWWPMIINPWQDAWDFSGVPHDDLYWGMCPALAINGSRPWRVHRERIRVLTDLILEVAPLPTAPSEAGTEAAASDSSWHVPSSAGITAPSECESEFVTAGALEVPASKG